VEEKVRLNGLKGALTEKVSMGKEFATFQKSKKDVAAARKLLDQLTKYETQLKKHSKEKYHSKLLYFVQAQKQ
jgi:hypothetical protein